MKSPNLVMYGASERNADMLYATGLLSPDPFVYLRLRGRCFLIVPDLEVARLRRLKGRCRILPLGAFPAAGHNGAHFGHYDFLARVIRALLREERIKKLVAPMDFPYGLARQLRRLKVKLKVADGPLFPERATKSSEEIKKISAALIMAEVGLAEGVQVLKNCKVGRERKLTYHNSPLTAEKLRAIMNTAIYQAGGVPGNTIVAGGAQSCDPHEPGHGVLRAGEPIVLDVFPRSQKTGYFGDITRTVVKGRASEALRRLHDAVCRGQQLAFAHLRHGRPAREVHAAVLNFFHQQGFPTRLQSRRKEGFFHGTGHGVGLELHEAPLVADQSPDTLLQGQVICIEPGLYYPELGGMRMEDMVVVGRRGIKNLTQFDRQLEV
ncbi:MAG: Xaa-Pro peptidase family protein [Verrucomicrobiae bacterium]|nr:Xaa-Pro peptidase family protein [Verrucomicrobiae bacterium]